MFCLSAVVCSQHESGSFVEFEVWFTHSQTAKEDWKRIGAECLKFPATVVSLGFKLQ